MSFPENGVTLEIEDSEGNIVESKKINNGFTIGVMHDKEVGVIQSYSSPFVSTEYISSIEVAYPNFLMDNDVDVDICDINGNIIKTALLDKTMRWIYVDIEIDEGYVIEKLNNTKLYFKKFS